MLITVLFLLSFQDLNAEMGRNWEELARPWMTSEELTLFERLDESNRKKFRGPFVARRLDHPELWPGTGLYLPAFFCPNNFGDIRDQISFALGKPLEILPTEGNSRIPRLWRYSGGEYYFVQEVGSDRVKLARRSIDQWDQVLRGLIRHPQIRYDFNVRSFGRTRLPEDLSWLPTTIPGFWLEPGVSGAQLHLMVDIPQSYRDLVRGTTASPTQHMEALLLLHRDGEESFAQLVDADRVRHGSQWVNLLEAPSMTFDVQLPPGFYDVEVLVYSGFLSHGIRARQTMSITPPELPRIGDPILSQSWSAASLEVPEQWVVTAGGVAYQPTAGYDPALPARVLVHSLLDDTRLQVQNGSNLVLEMKPVEQDGFWFRFDLPPQMPGFRLLALGFQTGNNQVAVSSKGALPAVGPSSNAFQQNGHNDYLSLENLTFKSGADLTLLSVNGHALAASRNGSFIWPGIDWGARAELRFEFARAGSWIGEAYTLGRGSVYQEIRVKPRFLVAGTRHLTGEVEAVDFKVRIDGKPAQIVKRTPMADTPKLWGIVVNDPLLLSPAWPTIRESLAQWASKGTGPNDLVYIVHISHRPELIQEPTPFKPMIRAGLDSLKPKTRNDNVFTVKYLIDALTHLEDHGTRSHQVLLLTNQLTDEVEQMQSLIPVLRQTGLQIYNLEFPFEFQPDSETLVAELKPDALTAMGERERQYQQERLAIRDHFMEDRNVLTPIASYRFGAGKAKKQAREVAIREEAFKDSFDQQLAALTAGIAHSSGYGETIQSLHMFFESLTRWQQTLVHVELSQQHPKEDSIRLETPDGYVAYWTLVEWR